MSEHSQHSERESMEFDVVIVAGDFNTSPFMWAEGNVPLVPTAQVVDTDQAPMLDDYMSRLGYATPTAEVGPTERKYGVEAETKPRQVPYKETIRKGIEKVRGRHKKQSGGHGQFGDVVVTIGPLARGQGFEFSDKITGGVVPKNYIPSVEIGVRDYLHTGPLGFPVVDVAVCLIDGSLQFSDLRGLLRVPAVAPSIVNLPTDRIREQDLIEVMWRDPSGIDILLAPPRVEMAEMVTVRDIEKALSILRQLYDFVIVDTRAALSDELLVFLDSSDLILQVLTYDTMAIRSLAMAGEAFDAIGYPATKLATILNRADAAGGFSKVDVEEALGRSIDYEVVSDGRLVLAANNEGVPFVSASPETPISEGIRRIASSLGAHLANRAPALAR